MYWKAIHNNASGAAVVLLFSAALAFTPNKQETPVPKKEPLPNIIIILADDMGYADVGFNGCTDIPTPNIDRIAQQGTVFDNGYVSYAVCSPSRAGLLTGRYQDRFGYSRNPLYKPMDESIGLPAAEQILPEWLSQAGYNTMGIGKWHLGAHSNFYPWKRGFKEYFGFLGGGHRYFPNEYNISHPDSADNESESYRTKLMRNDKVVEETAYLTDALSREAVAFIERNKQTPFFLYLAYNAPHSPLQASEKYLQRFAHLPAGKRKTYAAMVSAVDDGVGAVLDKLSQLKLTDNTLVIFLSDNGGPEQDNGSNNGPLRGGKGSLFEGGIRVPFAMQWPGKISSGSRYTHPVIALDIFATIAESISGKPTKNPLDGVNLLPYLSGVKSGSPHEYLFWRQYDQNNYAVVHQSGYKQLTLKDSARYLYMLPSDIGEAHAIANPEQNQRMEQQLAGWKQQLQPPFFLGLNQEAEYQQKNKKQQ